MKIIPSIDIMKGRAVQLRQGKEFVLDGGDPLELARKFAIYGEIALVDLDAAFGTGENADLIAQLCQVANCRVGGGLRDEKAVRRAIAGGAKRVVIGTAATPEFLSKFPADWIVVALDARGGEVVTEGWKKSTGVAPEERIGELEPYCSEFLYTAVEREGMMGGTDLETIARLKKRSSRPITAAGGITTVEEIQALREMEVNAQLGMAVYTGKLDLVDAALATVDFAKAHGRVATIAQEARSGQVLMLAYSTPESLRKAIVEGKGWYYSRSRAALWMKGESSGHTQALKSFAPDCDGDALLFTVEQTGPACHGGSGSCFGAHEGRSVSDLYRLLLARFDKPTDRSYTARLLADPALLKAKILEEAGELAEFEDRGNLIHEAADLAYHSLVLLAREKVRPEEVRAQLRSRGKREENG